MLKTIQFRGQPAAYEIRGEGLPVMLIHGFPADRRIWEPLLAGLENKVQWILPDLPGRGDSPENATLKSLSDFAEYIQAIVETESIPELVLIGHSMGGYISLAYAEKYPERVRGLGLFHSSSYPDTAERKDTRDKNIAFIRKNGGKAFIEMAIPGLFTDSYKENHPREIQELIDRYANFKPDPLVQYLEAMKERPATTGVLKSIDKPVLFIMGEEDKAVPVKDALEQCHIPRISYIHVLTHTAHMGMFENTSRCQQIVGRFLEQFH